MSKVNFRFSTDILRRLGEELNPTPDQGLIELVKNAYDANANHCTIELIKTTTPGGTICITDDGDGMSADDILNGWLVLGKSRKSNQEITRLGRIPAGDKGLGRLAALRLGDVTTLNSITLKNTDVECELEVNWSLFDSANIVEDVELEIVEKKHDTKKEAGSVIIIENLKSAISRNDIKRLARTMILLADPFGDNPLGFEPILKVPEFKDLEKLVEARYFGDAEYHLIANIDEKGYASAKVVDWRGNEIFKASHAELRPKTPDLKYDCPVAKFDLWAFILDNITFSTRSSTLGEVKSWLNEFGGVHFYYNNLRVTPYGDGNDDWLGLNVMRVKSPEVRPSTNTSIGRVMVCDTEDHLKQKTDRSGFIENETFKELQKFCVDALQWMAKKRLEVAEKRRRKARETATTESNKAKDSVETQISTVSDDKVRKNIARVFKDYEKNKAKEVNQLKKEIQLYRTLSTAGITSAVFAHESANNPVKLIAQSIKTIRHRSEKYVNDFYQERIKKPVDRIDHSVESLKVLANVTLSLVDFEKRRTSKVDIHKVVKFVVELYSPFVKDRDANVACELDIGSPYFQGSEAALESIITNLLNNSLVAFEDSLLEERKIIIRTTVNSETVFLRVLDNGPGIKGIALCDIWLPGETTTNNGSGLGLTIVRDAVSDLGGNVNAIENGELGGAEIVLELPIIGA